MSLYSFLAAMALLFAGGFIYITLSAPMAKMYEVVDPMVNESGTVFASSTSDTMITIKNTWAGFILFFFIGILIWALASISKKEEYPGGGY